MTLVATVALGSSTYAWFASNSKVSATGAAVRTQVSNNLFIADRSNASTKLGLDFTTIPDDAYFGTSVVLNAPATAALLEPVSTVNAKDYFYNLTINTLASGARADAGINYVTYDHANTVADQNGATTTFDENYGTTNAKGYVDYTFALKAVNAQTVSQYINLKKLNFTYEGTTDTSKAFRAALFFDKANGTAVPATPTNLNSIKSLSDAVYFVSGSAVSAENAVTAVNTDILNNATAVEVEAGKTEYYKVTVRVWLEGEDQTCNNSTFLNLKDDWYLDLEFELEATASTDNAAKYLTYAVTAAKENLTGSSDSSAVTIDNVAYYQIGSTDYYLTAPSTAYDGNQNVYKVIDNRYVQDVTDFVTYETSNP